MARGRHPTRIRIDPPTEQQAAAYLLVWRGMELHDNPKRFPALTSSELFGNDRPLEIDFGCGTGILACGRARKFPDVNFLGIDLSQKPLFCAVRDAAAGKLENVKFIRGNFNLMRPLLRPQTVSAAYYLFPNPPRDYHQGRANAGRGLFFQSVHDSLILGGHFYFATDSSLFFECVRGIITNELGYKAVERGPVDSDVSSGYRRIWDNRGKSVKSLVIEKE